jgi:hypothetical protein
MGPPAPAGAGGTAQQMSHYWRLSGTITACSVSGRILFLDVARDRYVALPQDRNDCFLSWLRSPVGAPPEACCPILAELGLDDQAVPPAPTSCFVARPIAMDSPCLDRRHVRIREMLSVAHAVISARADLRSRPVADVLARYAPPSAHGSGPAADLQARLAIFRSARALVPVGRLCLHDCLALIRWLGPSARGITLVLGVSALPFAAHSWMQSGAMVLDDHPESPSRYQPILHLP